MFTPDGSFNSHCGSWSYNLHSHTHIHSLRISEGLRVCQGWSSTLSIVGGSNKARFITSYTQSHGGEIKSRPLVTNMWKVSSMHMWNHHMWSMCPHTCYWIVATYFSWMWWGRNQVEGVLFISKYVEELRETKRWCKNQDISKKRWDGDTYVNREKFAFDS